MTILNAGGLPALLRNVITRELLHHCGICGQWIASPTALKNHYRSLHADLFDRLAGQVDKQVMRHGIALNPCLYCNTSHRYSRQHIPHCISLWQSCFLHALSENGSHDGSHKLSRGPGGAGTTSELLRGRTSQQEEHGGAAVSRAEGQVPENGERSRSPRRPSAFKAKGAGAVRAAVAGPNPTPTIEASRVDPRRTPRMQNSCICWRRQWCDTKIR